MTKSQLVLKLESIKFDHIAHYVIYCLGQLILRKALIIIKLRVHNNVIFGQFKCTITKFVFGQRTVTKPT